MYPHPCSKARLAAAASWCCLLCSSPQSLEAVTHSCITALTKQGSQQGSALPPSLLCTALGQSTLLLWQSVPAAEGCKTVLAKFPPWHPERRDCCSQSTEICSATRDGSAASTHGVLQQLLASSSPQPRAKQVGPKGHLSEPGRMSKGANPPSFDCTLCRATYKAPKGSPCWNLPASTKCSVLKVCSHSPAVCKQTCTLAGRAAAQRCLFAQEGGNSELWEEHCVCCAMGCKACTPGIQNRHGTASQQSMAPARVPAPKGPYQ